MSVVADRPDPLGGLHVEGPVLDPALASFVGQFPIPIRNHPAIEEAWQHRHAIWTGDMAADPRVHRATYERFPHQSDVFVPISIKERPVGGFFVIWWHATTR